MQDDVYDRPEIWRSIQPVMRIDMRTRSERKLARALLLCTTMHLLRNDRKHCLEMGNYNGAQFLDRKIEKRIAKCLEALEEHYHID
jgi:hypothetical protein